MLNVTRLKHFKNRPFTDKSQKSSQSGGQDDENVSEEAKADTSVVEIIAELSAARKVCKPFAAVDKYSSANFCAK